MPKRSDIMRPVLAGGGAVIVDRFIVNPLAGTMGLNVSDDVLKIVAGAALPMFVKNRLVRDIAQAEIVIGANNLLSGMLGGMSAPSNGGGGIEIVR